MCKLNAIKTNFEKEVLVADIKRRTLESIIQIAGQCQQIDYIILFGSVLEERCTDNSDIDITIVSNVAKSKLFKSKDYDKFLEKLYKIDMDQEYDILYFHSIDEITKRKESVCKEIMDKGQIIYKKGA